MIVGAWADRIVPPGLVPGAFIVPRGPDEPANKSARPVPKDARYEKHLITKRSTYVSCSGYGVFWVRECFRYETITLQVN